MQNCADPYGTRACRRWLVHPARRIIYTTNQDRAKHISLRRRYTLLAAFSHLYPKLPLRSTSRSLFAARTPRCLGACGQHQAFITGRLAGETMKLCGAGRRCRWLLGFRGCLRYGKSSLKQLLARLPSGCCDLLFLCNRSFISLLPHAQFPTAALKTC